MKKYLPSLLFLLFMTGCEKEEQNSRKQLLQEHIFNGSSQWVITRMEADTEREINGQTTTLWSEQYPQCRMDNVYQFGSLGNTIASIQIDESTSSCDSEEPEYVHQGLFIEFSSEYKKAAVSIRGAAMAKVFDLSYDSRLQLNVFKHSWEFEEISPERLVVKASIPAEQSGGMLEKAGIVFITFGRIP